MAKDKFTYLHDLMLNHEHGAGFIPEIFDNDTLRTQLGMAGNIGGAGKDSQSTIMAYGTYGSPMMQKELGDVWKVRAAFNTPDPLELQGGFQPEQELPYELFMYPIPRYPVSKGVMMNYELLYKAYQYDPEWVDMQLAHMTKGVDRLHLAGQFWHSGVAHEFLDKIRAKGVDVVTTYRGHATDQVSVRAKDPTYYEANKKPYTDFQMSREEANYRNFDLVYFATETGRQEAAAAHDGVNGWTKEEFLAKSIVLPLVIETDEFSPDPDYKESLRRKALTKGPLAKYGIDPDGPPIIGGVYRLEWKEKGLDVLVDRYIEQRRQLGEQDSSHSRLLIVGGKNEKDGNDRVEAKIRENIAAAPAWVQKDIMIHMGSIPFKNIYPVFNGGLVYLGPDETLGMAEVEGMAGGMPEVLSSNASGHADKGVHPEGTAIMCDIYNPESVIKALNEICDPKVRAELSAAAVGPSKQFSPHTVMVKQHNELKSRYPDFFDSKRYY